MAGRHVGQILEHPQAAGWPGALFAPLVQIDGPGWQLTLTWAASANSGSSLAIRPAPNSTPKRVGSSLLLSTLPSSSARWAAATASWIVRAINLRLRAVFLLDVVLGVEVGDLAGEADGQGGGVEGLDGADAAAAR